MVEYLKKALSSNPKTTKSKTKKKNLFHTVIETGKPNQASSKFAIC
jgi:hypothetical protein